MQLPPFPKPTLPSAPPSAPRRRGRRWVDASAAAAFTQVGQGQGPCARLAGLAPAGLVGHTTAPGRPTPAAPPCASPTATGTPRAPDLTRCAFSPLPVDRRIIPIQPVCHASTNVPDPSHAGLSPALASSLQPIPATLTPPRSLEPPPLLSGRRALPSCIATVCGRVSAVGGQGAI